ncbi:MAG: glycosyltransferase family 39 protein [Chloroflexi bacterium]|nr:glycosyltransferase family 39 protein [Chloroflexota bacterium]
MNKLHRLTQKEIGILIAMLATIFGGWVRLFAPAIAGFPINDGGLFYVMMRAIQENNFQLPTYVQYNGLDIPFAYPPLGLYAGALLSSLFRINLLDVVRWLPAIVLIFTIPAFYLLAKTIFDSDFKAGIAALIFAFTPRTMTWPIMGGGVTRSFGYVFLLLTLTNVYLLFTKREKKYLLLSILFGSLTVLSHPEAAVQTIGFGLLFWIFKGRDKAGTLNALYVGIGTLALSAIWWIPLLLRFGPKPILAAAQTGSNSALAILFPIFAVLTDEPLMTLIAALGLIGFIMRLAQKDYLTPAMYILPFIVEPRSAATYAMIPFAMLAGVALTDLILPPLSSINRRAAPALMLFIGFYLLGGAFYFDTQIAGSTVPPADREAFDWIKANTPQDSRFLVLTGENELFCDGVSEWFPALTSRLSLTTVQGTEWLRGRFAAAASTQSTIQNCLSGNDALNCVEQTARRVNLQYDFIYVVRQSSIKNFCRAVALSPRGEAILSALNDNSRYSRVYQTDEVSIFSFQH